MGLDQTKKLLHSEATLQQNEKTTSWVKGNIWKLYLYDNLYNIQSV